VSGPTAGTPRLESHTTLRRVQHDLGNTAGFRPVFALVSGLCAVLERYNEGALLL
jgi:hypothetical protein